MHAKLGRAEPNPARAMPIPLTTEECLGSTPPRVQEEAIEKCQFRAPTHQKVPVQGTHPLKGAIPGHIPIEVGIWSGFLSISLRVCSLYPPPKPLVLVGTGVPFTSSQVSLRSCPAFCDSGSGVIDAFYEFPGIAFQAKLLSSLIFW